MSRDRGPRGGAIKAVTVDCWGTLLLDSPRSDERYSAERLAGIEAVLARAGHGVGRHDLTRAYAALGRRLGRIWAQCRDVPVGQHVTMLLEMVDPGLPGCLDRASIEAMIEAYAGPALISPPAVDPGAVAALERLAADGIAFGIVSNIMRTPGRVLTQIFERAGLLRHFKVLSFSDECGIRKPDPEIFRLTLRQVGASPGEAVHVGDDPVLDVEGARQAGMGVVQVAARGQVSGRVKPDAVIAELGELPAALGRLGS